MGQTRFSWRLHSAGQISEIILHRGTHYSLQSNVHLFIICWAVDMKMKCCHKQDKEKEKINTLRKVRRISGWS